jgi:hypothetical protein
VLQYTYSCHGAYDLGLKIKRISLSKTSGFGGGGNGDAAHTARSIEFLNATSLEHSCRFTLITSPSAVCLT